MNEEEPHDDSDRTESDDTDYLPSSDGESDEEEEAPEEDQKTSHSVKEQVAGVSAEELKALAQESGLSTEEIAKQEQEVADRKRTRASMLSLEQERLALEQSKKLRRLIDADDGNGLTEIEKKEKQDRVESIWAQMKQSSTAGSVAGGSQGSQIPKNETVLKTDEKTSKVTVTKEYVYAGEKVVVEEQVSAEEAAKLQSSLSILQPKSDASSSKILKQSKAPVVRRAPSKLDALSQQLKSGKPQKLNTLEKTKLDWNRFVKKEGIQDELKQHNKDGYLDKVAFLQRSADKEAEALAKLRKAQRKF